jgi:diadenosine tetraphosphate (Ap4A) HIT family hydrolase
MELRDDHACDGCRPEVLSAQERWRADDVRVIRPRRVVVDSQVIVLPLRHAASLGDLVAAEVVSIIARLGEVREQFEMASGMTGLSCFANDGTAAHQETPHVRLHVVGRSRGVEAGACRRQYFLDRVADHVRGKQRNSQIVSDCLRHGGRPPCSNDRSDPYAPGEDRECHNDAGLRAP